MQDEHFAVASTMCTSTFKMDYYLKLEEMAEWFPCWMQARSTALQSLLGPCFQCLLLGTLRKPAPWLCAS